MAKKSRPGPRWSAVHGGAEYTADQVEFMLALDAKKRKVRRHLDCRDILAAAHSLGYRGTVSPGPSS